MLDGVIFDLDGTLGDTLPVCVAAFRTVFTRHLGTVHTDEEIRAMFGPSEEGVLVATLGHVPMALDEYLGEYARLHDGVPDPFPGIVGLLDRLDGAEVPMAVVTGKGPRSAQISLSRWGLTERFSAIAAGSGGGNVKPDNMRRIVARWKASPERVVAVGDAPTDISAATQNGIVAVAAAWAPGVDRAHLEEMRPAATFETVAALESWLMERAAE